MAQTLKALGMNYPMQDGQQGYFDLVYDTFTSEEIKLINLMHTNTGERIMEPEFGLSTRKYLFENITPQLKTNIEVDIRNKINFWLPNLLINSLVVNIEATTDADKNTIFVTINFSLVQNPTQFDEITFQLS